MASQETTHPKTPRGEPSLLLRDTPSEESGDLNAADEISRSVGSSLREIRRSKGLTLDELSAVTGFTKGYLSKVETGRNAPPIATLARIAKALKTEVAALLQDVGHTSSEAGQRISVVRADERSRVMRGGTSFGYDFQILVHNRVNRHMEPFIFTFPSQVLKELFFEHPGEEMVFVLSGNVEMQIGEDSYVLSPGDCIYFDSSIPHRGRGVNGEAKAIVVIYSTDADGR